MEPLRCFLSITSLNTTRILPVETASASDRAVALALVQTVGGLPLALDQAGAYVAETKRSLSDYLDLFKKRQKALLDRRGTLAYEHPRSVVATFSLAFEQVQQKNEAAIDLLKLCAYLAPDAIPLEIFTKGAVYLGTVLGPVAADALQLDQALETLQAYSLVRRDGASRMLSLHRLVQAVLQDTLEETQQRAWKQRAVQAVSAASPNVQDVEQWDACDQWVPHVLVCAIWIQKERLDSEESTALLNQAGYYLDDRARYSEAEPLYLLALAIRERVLGPEHPDTADSLNNLAQLYQNQEKYTEAEPLLKRALTICEQWLGSEHPITQRVLKNHTDLLQKMEEAEDQEES